MFVLLETLMSFTTLSTSLAYSACYGPITSISTYAEMHLFIVAPIDFSAEGLTAAAMWKLRYDKLLYFRAFYCLIGQVNSSLV